MDRGSCLFSLCILIFCIFQTARFSNGDECPCLKIPVVNLTKTPPEECFHIGQKFRYECQAGYVREAGTSSLIRCIQTSSGVAWTKSHLKCKRDPKISTREPTTPPLIKETTNIETTSTDPTTSDSLLGKTYSPKNYALFRSPCRCSIGYRDKTKTVEGGCHKDISNTERSAGMTGKYWLCSACDNNRPEVTLKVEKAEKPNFVTEATNAPAPPPIAGNHTADFASEPKYIVSSCIALVCVALVGGIIYIFYKRRTATAALPLPAEQVPMANDPF